MTRRERRELEQRQGAAAEQAQQIQQAERAERAERAETAAAPSPEPLAPPSSPVSQAEPFERLVQPVSGASSPAGSSPAGSPPAGSPPPAGAPADPFVASRVGRRADAYDDYHQPKRKRRGPWGCLIGLLIVGGLVAGAAVFLQGPITAAIDYFTPAADYEGAGTGEVVFMIHEGDTGASIAENLAAQDVVASYDAFYDLLLAQSPEPEFQPGAYRLANRMSSQAALDALTDPANKLENTFVITEGMWAVNALAEAAAVSGIPVDELEAAAADPQSLGLPAEATSVEGFLFPATYTIDPGITATELVQMLVDRSFQALDAAGVAPEDRWNTIVKASLIQREAGLRDDYYKISRVIDNRLNPELFESGLLQFDSTVHYGLGDDSVVTTTDAERADPGNPFNTYVHPGMTPGPIGNPGDLAIDAALHPADGPWLYFVTWNLDTGETIFSATIEEHEAGVAKWLAWMDEHPEYG